MSFILFEHNKRAYEDALAMLQENKKAAIIHPTGTGKSFICFKFCEDFYDKRVCWLSPSEYIFKTQVENFVKAGGIVPTNITFYTYSKLMHLTKEEIETIKPDFIILDEFHRCGAQVWGKGVKRLLERFNEAYLLGLSATAIRYLDNQRNMADELFMGNVASELTLGDAIVQGILNPPLYVATTYTYKENIEKLEEKIKKVKNQKTRDEAYAYLEKLKRSLEMSLGLDDLFEKYIDDINGKYICFCSSIKHLNEMVKNVGKWFGKVNENIRVYKTYANEPDGDVEFAKFKSDTSESLKLLFCIDMLNEGVHVEDINGVILFRPTVSPIIYKQQIGRALSATKNKKPIIFDVVNNLENLYTVGTIENEIKVAMTYYLDNGMEEKIVNDHFEIVDNLKDSINVFNQLNECLSASWEQMYQLAKDYYLQNNNLNISKRYKTSKGYSLGSWLYTQKRVYNHEQIGYLDEERIKKLENIGIIWESSKDIIWDKYYQACVKYYQKFKNLNVNVDYVINDVKLGKWINQLRFYRKNNIQSNFLTNQRIIMLNNLGMIWNVTDHLWEVNYNEAKSYYQEFGNLNVPVNYVTENKVKLGLWISRIKGLQTGIIKGNKLTDHQVKLLNDIGMNWNNKYHLDWLKGFEEAKRYYQEFGNLNLKQTFKSNSGFKLGRWIYLQREKGKGKLSEEKIKLLNEINFPWKNELQDIMKI